MKLLVDTGVFSAALSRRSRPDLDPAVARLAGNQLFIAVQTVAELRYGALVAGWADRRRVRLEAAIAAITVLPVTDECCTVLRASGMHVEFRDIPSLIGFTTPICGLRRLQLMPECRYSAPTVSIATCPDSPSPERAIGGDPYRPPDHREPGHGVNHSSKRATTSAACWSARRVRWA